MERRNIVGSAEIIVILLVSTKSYNVRFFFYRFLGHGGKDGVRSAESRSHGVRSHGVTEYGVCL